MNQPVFTFQDAWAGGNFGLLLFYGNVEAHVVGQALAALWKLPQLDGCWLEHDKEPVEQHRFDPASGETTLDQVLRGISILPGGSRVACCSSTRIPGDESEWWLSFDIPMGSLCRACPVGAYPFDDGTPTDWIIPVSEWFLEVASAIFTRAPFQAGAIGWLPGIEADDIVEVAKSTIPHERWVGFLRRQQEGSVLEWFPPNQYGPQIVVDRDG